MDFTGCLNDDDIGPAVLGCRSDFDFTIKFEQIFLAIIPSIVFIALSLPRAAILLQKSNIIAGRWFQLFKLGAISVYAAIQLALLVLSALRARHYAAWLNSSSALGFVAAICMGGLSFFEHARSPRPSLLLNIYLVLSLLFDIAQTRTFWLASANPSELVFSQLFTTSVAVKALLVLLEGQQKSRWVLWEPKEHSPEETSSLYGLGGYFWVNSLFHAGYKRMLTLDDLFPLDPAMSAEILEPRFTATMARSKRGRKHGVAKDLFKTLAVPFLLPVAPRIGLMAFRFCQPFLIHTVVEFLQQPDDGPSKNKGYGLIAAALLIYTGIATSNALYWYFQQRAVCMGRGCLASAIYKKTTTVRATASEDKAALTLMSADVERIKKGLLTIHEFWACLIEICVGSWLLSRQLGAAFVAPVIVVICCVILSYWTNKLAGPRQTEWMAQIQKRVGLTAGVITHMKHLKISGMATPVESLIQGMRADEIQAGARFRIISLLNAALGFFPVTMSPVFTFAATSSTLTVSSIFTSLSFLILLTEPLSYVFQTVPVVIAAMACLTRIQSFLEQDPRDDFRDIPALTEKGELSNDDASPESESKPAMRITDGSYGWEDDKHSLSHLDLTIPAGKLTIVVGPVASGKSTLCKAILGEVPMADGRTTLHQPSRRLGYCDQVPYLSNATIKENIIGFSPFDRARYDEVIEATALKPDFEVLPQGDETNVGSNGITLSGGQKQRVSMARALYLDSDFLVFDDVLSGLDADTEAYVFRKVFGLEGIIPRRGATAVLCTHSVRHLPSADHVVALGTDGTIVEQGTFPNLLANKNYVYSLGVTEAVKGESSEDVALAAAIPHRPELMKMVTQQSTASTIEDARGKPMADRSVYKHYFRSMGLVPLLLFLLCGLTYGFFFSFQGIWLKFWSEDIGSANPARPNAYYIGLYAVFQLGTLAGLFFGCYLCVITMVRMSGTQLHTNTLHTVVCAPLIFFTSTDTGTIINLFSQDMTIIDGELPNSLLNVGLDCWSILGQAAVIATSSPYLLAVYPFLFGMLYILCKFYLRTSKQLRILELEAKSPLYTNFLDTIKGVVTYRAFGWMPNGISLNTRLLDRSQRPEYLLVMVQHWLGFALQMIVAALAVTVISLSTQLRSSSGFTGASLVALMSFGESLTYVIRFYTMLETSLGAVSRLKTFQDTTKNESGEGEDVIPPPEWPLKGGLEIQGVSASYDKLEDESPRSSVSSGSSNGPRNLAIKNMTVSIRPGEKVAICGRSGSGKSSTILLLLRLLDPRPECAENITIDSTPLHKIDRATLRQRIIAVPQDPVFLPDGTPIRANLDIFEAATEEECRQVLEAVDLWHFVSERGGLAAGMSEDTLSQGQKQLFSLARAMLRRRVRRRRQEAEYGATMTEKRLEKAAATQPGGILLLDEVSSSVDQDTDRAMQNIIKEEFAGYTIIMVSHRLEMVMDFDTVIVMDKGAVVEQGAPRVLAEQEGSRFRDLWLVGNNA